MPHSPSPDNRGQRPDDIGDSDYSEQLYQSSMRRPGPGLLQVGERLGAYEILQFQGRGAFSEVYRAETRAGMPVAIKIADKVGGGNFLNRFDKITDVRSAKAISPDEIPAQAYIFRASGPKADFLNQKETNELLRAQVSLLEPYFHPNLVSCVESFESDGRTVAVLEYAHGRTLREVMRSGKPGFAVKAEWFYELTHTLLEIRQQSAQLNIEPQFVHADLRPENIIVTPDRKLNLIDPAPPFVTIEERVKGKEGLRFFTTSAHYNPFLRHDSRTDVVAIGIMLYEAHTRALPFDDPPWRYAGCDMAGDVERNDLSNFISYPEPSQLIPDFPKRLERIISHAIRDEHYNLEDLHYDLDLYLHP